MLGAGNLQKVVVDDARRLGVESATEVIGSVDDIRSHLEWADVLLLTSLTEGFPGVVLEAAAAGIPTVAFDVGGTAEAIVDGVTGFVVDRQDVDAAVERLVEFARDPDKLSAMGAVARDRVQNQFMMSHAVDRYAALLDKAIATRSGSGKA